jgi:hypothetical protein
VSEKRVALANIGDRFGYMKRPAKDYRGRAPLSEALGAGRAEEAEHIAADFAAPTLSKVSP